MEHEPAEVAQPQRAVVGGDGGRGGSTLEEPLRGNEHFLGQKSQYTHGPEDLPQPRRIIHDDQPNWDQLKYEETPAGRIARNRDAFTAQYPPTKRQPRPAASAVALGESLATREDTAPNNNNVAHPMPELPPAGCFDPDAPGNAPVITGYDHDFRNVTAELANNVCLNGLAAGVGVESFPHKTPEFEKDQRLSCGPDKTIANKDVHPERRAGSGVGPDAEVGPAARGSTPNTEETEKRDERTAAAAAAATATGIGGATGIVSRCMDYLRGNISDEEYELPETEPEEQTQPQRDMDEPANKQPLFDDQLEPALQPQRRRHVSDEDQLGKDHSIESPTQADAGRRLPQMPGSYDQVPPRRSDVSDEDQLGKDHTIESPAPQAQPSFDQGYFAAANPPSPQEQQPGAAGATQATATAAKEPSSANEQFRKQSQGSELDEYPTSSRPKNTASGQELPTVAAREPSSSYDQWRKQSQGSELDEYPTTTGDRATEQRGISTAAAAQGPSSANERLRRQIQTGDVSTGGRAQALGFNEEQPKAVLAAREPSSGNEQLRRQTHTGDASTGGPAAAHATTVGGGREQAPYTSKAPKEPSAQNEQLRQQALKGDTMPASAIAEKRAVAGAQPAAAGVRLEPGVDQALPSNQGQWQQQAPSSGLDTGAGVAGGIAGGGLGIYTADAIENRNKQQQRQPGMTTSQQQQSSQQAPITQEVHPTERHPREEQRPPTTTAAPQQPEIRQTDQHAKRPSHGSQGAARSASAVGVSSAGAGATQQQTQQQQQQQQQPAVTSSNNNHRPSREPNTLDGAVGGVGIGAVGNTTSRRSSEKRASIQEYISGKFDERRGSWKVIYFFFLFRS